MIDRLSPTVRNLALLLIFLFSGWFLWSVRSVLNPLILAYLLAFVVHPLVLRLERRGWQRRRAVNVIFGGVAVLLTLIGLGIWFQGRGLAQELASERGLGLKVRQRLEQAIEEHHDEISWLIQVLPRGGDESRPDEARPMEDPRRDERKSDDTHLDPKRSVPKDLDAQGTGETSTGVPPDRPGDAVQRDDAAPDALSPTDASPSLAAGTAKTSQNERAEQLKRQLGEWWESWVSDPTGAPAADLGAKFGAGLVFLLQQVFGSLLSIFTLLILLPIYTYFLLFELERIHRFVARYLPRRDRARLVRIGGQIGEVLANFFRGRLLVCLAKGAFLTLGLYIAGIDYALLIGLGTGFLSLVPFVGSAIGFVLALVVGMLEHSLVGALVRVGIVFFAAEMLENYVLIPRILGNSLGLHPIIVIFSLMAGAASMGMFGLLIALPLTATLVILAREFLLPTLADLADRDRPA